MNTQNVIQLGNPKLRLISKSVNKDEFGTQQLASLIKTLFATMLEKGGIGIAAPQLGINKRVFVFGLNDDNLPSHIHPIPNTVLINPYIEFLSDDTEEDYEGCLSVGNLRGKVPRCNRIYYKGFDAEGNIIEDEVVGLHARVVQHEYDHLEGIMFLDRIRNYGSMGFHDELIESGQLKPRHTRDNSDLSSEKTG